MELLDYDKRVGHHLKMIASGADMVSRHVKYLQFQVNFETLAMDQIQAAYTDLRVALAKVEAAALAYSALPVREV